MASARPKTDLATSERMARQARVNTRPEVELRKCLHARGLRYRVGLRVPELPRRTIDIAFTKIRLAVFVDGCFWHSCPQHGTRPRRNGEWWQDKLEANVLRDRETDARLANEGWEVVRVWEHELPQKAAARVEGIVRLRGAATLDDRAQRSARRLLPLDGDAGNADSGA